MYKYADSHCYTLETNTALKSNHIPMKFFKKSQKNNECQDQNFYQLDHLQISGENSYICVYEYTHLSIPGGLDDKASAYNAGDLGSMPGSGRSPGEGNSNPLLYSCLENPMDGETWQAILHRVAKSRTRLSDFTLHICVCICVCVYTYIYIYIYIYVYIYVSHTLSSSEELPHKYLHLNLYLKE